MTDLIAATSRHLGEILDLCTALPGRAADLGGSPLMPGGGAMVELGPVARLDVWERRQELDETTGVRHDHAEDADPDEHWTAYQTLRYWSQAWRIDHAIAVQPFDLDDSTIPQEAFLEQDAVSFTKGCFIGQELVCRIDSRGHVNRFLRAIDILGDVTGAARPAPGDEIVVDGKVVGAITSVTPEGARPVALGYVRREVEPPADVLLRGGAREVAARVRG